MFQLVDGEYEVCVLIVCIDLILVFGYFKIIKGWKEIEFFKVFGMF